MTGEEREYDSDLGNREKSLKEGPGSIKSL